MIRTADVLRFVKAPSAQKSAKVRQGEPRYARGSSNHTCVKTVASTYDINHSGLQSPNRLTNRQEFDLIKSHEKEALFLSERFGDRRETYRIIGHASLINNRDPGFAQDVLHLSKGKID